MVELCRARAHITCAYGNIAVVYSAQSPEPAYCDRNAREIVAWGSRYPDGLGLMILISADEPPPDEPTRRALQASYITVQQTVRAAVHVVEGEGFIASAKRSVITLINISNSVSFPLKVASNVHEGVLKLSKLLGPGLSAGLDTEDFLQAVAAMRTRVSRA